jgi:hypothetical protein
MTTMIKEDLEKTIKKCKDLGFICHEDITALYAGKIKVESCSVGPLADASMNQYNAMRQKRSEAGEALRIAINEDLEIKLTVKKLVDKLMEDVCTKGAFRLNKSRTREALVSTFINTLMNLVSYEIASIPQIKNISEKDFVWEFPDIDTLVILEKIKKEAMAIFDKIEAKCLGKVL